MSTTALTIEDQASEFAAAVREHLADLPEHEIDELLDGLQADLTERLADGGELGDAFAYADELRQAAGLPARDGKSSSKSKKRVRESIRATRISHTERTQTFWRATPARRAVRDFALSLQPLWWVARGAVIAWVVLAAFGRGIGLDIDVFTVAVGGAFIVVSVQWGRGKWLPKAWLVVLRKVASIVAAVLLLPFIVVGTNAVAAPNYIYVDDYAPGGLMSEGAQVTNIFAFDCFGQPIEAVQLFDQNGQPIVTQPGEGMGEFYGWDEKRQQEIRYERNGLADYAGLANVFPMQEARAGAGRDLSEATPQDAKWPMDETLPLSPECPSGTADEGEGDPAESTDQTNSNSTSTTREE